MHPFDKFREGLHKVTTEFCALCADDDLVVLDGVQRCLEALRSNPSASVAQGYSFSFLCRQDGGMDLGNILYFTPTIDDATPLARLAKLFARYQAATYGNYRTPVLQRIFDTLKPMQSILARELLGTALAAIEGHMIRVLCFSHGRSMDASESYEHWHPLEWFAKDPRGLFSEYHLYRELMAQAVLGRPDNTHDAAAVRRILDLIHLRYMVRHAPDGALAFIADQKMSGVPFDEYWPRPEIHQPLYEAACIGTSAAATPAASVERGLSGLERLYHLHPNFSAPLGMAAPAQEAIKDLLHSLDNYQPHLASAKTARAHLPARQALPTRTQPAFQPIRHGIGAAVQLQRCAIPSGFRSAPFALRPACRKRSSCSTTARPTTAWRLSRTSGVAIHLSAFSRTRPIAGCSTPSIAHSKRRVATSSYGPRQTIG